CVDRGIAVVIGGAALLARGPARLVDTALAHCAVVVARAHADRRVLVTGARAALPVALARRPARLLPHAADRVRAVAAVTAIGVVAPAPERDARGVAREDEARAALAVLVAQALGQRRLLGGARAEVATGARGAVVVEPTPTEPVDAQVGSAR